MAGRHSYMTELRAAISRIVVGRDSISLAALEAELPAHFHIELPSRVTLAKAITGPGWIKITHPGPGAVYRRQSINGAPTEVTAGAPANPSTCQPENAHDR